MMPDRDPFGNWQFPDEIRTCGAAVGLFMPINPEERRVAASADADPLTPTERDIIAKLGIAETDFIAARANLAGQDQ